MFPTKSPFLFIARTIAHKKKQRTIILKQRELSLDHRTLPNIPYTNTDKTEKSQTKN